MSYLTFLDPFLFIDVPWSLLCYDSMPWLYVMVIEMCMFYYVTDISISVPRSAMH